MRLLPVDRGIPGNSSGSIERFNGNRTQPNYGNRGMEVGVPIQERNHFPIGVPKLEFPGFNGPNREWIRNCGKFFQLYQIPADQQMDLAELHLEL